MNSPRHPWHMGMLLLLIVALMVSTVSVSAPIPRPKKNPLEEQVKPAITQAKLKANPALRVVEKRNRAVSANHLKQIGIAFHSYHDVHGRFPADRVGKDGKPALSWRVLLLPYLEESVLYKEFQLDEPWNSKANLKLLKKMPKVYASPRVMVKNKGYTTYQGFSGANAVFRPGKRPLSFASILDGTSNTLMVVESSTAVPWTRPVDLPADGKELPAFGKAYHDRPLAAMMDGSVRVLDLKKISTTTLRNAINPQDGNVLGADWNR